ncbi:MAG TPA: M14 family zinc carboxypeptidase, partial [Gemmatimonadales bacterium]
MHGVSGRTLLALALAAVAARPAAAQTDTAFARQVRAYTTDPRFLPASVATLPLSAAIPSPQKFFGTIAGAPDVEHHTAELYAYYRALAAASPRVRVLDEGPTEGGRRLALVVIADSATMQHLDAYRATLARLADPRTVPAESLDAVVARAKPVYYLMGGLHSTEMGPPEMLTELAFRLAAGEDSATRAIRDRVITVINPVAEPDGRDRQVDWYDHYTKGRTDIDDGFPLSSPYWGDYARHDDNRDGLQQALLLTQAVSREYYEWHPTVMHDLHESIALLYVSTGTGPYNLHNDPIAISEWQLLANNDITALDAQGLPGVWTWAFFDGWWPGYGVWVANNHNAIGRFYETFGNAGAGTYVRDLSRESYAGDSVTSRQWYRPAPPTRKVRWSARDNVNYMEAGVLASLTYAAQNGGQLLRNFWQKGVNSITRGRTETPYAYVIPALARQRDPKRAAYLVNQLERQGIEIRRRTAGDSAGDFVILRDQPYGDLVVNLLARTSYPASAKYPPYDDVAWTLGDLYGVSVSAVSDSAVFRWTGLEPLRDTVAATAAVRGAGPAYLLAYRAQGELLPALYALRKSDPAARAYAAESAFTVGADTFPVGSVIFEGVSPASAERMARADALALTGVARAPAVPRHELRTPRVAIYHTWFDTQDEGWARFTFEHTGIPYTAIDKDDLARGRLR